MRKRLAQLAGREIVMAAFGGLAITGRTKAEGRGEKLECRTSNSEREVLAGFYGVMVQRPMASSVILEGFVIPGGAVAVMRKSSGSSSFMIQEKSPAPDSPPVK